MSNRRPTADDFEPKFDDCLSCRNLGRSRVCNQCDAGELFDDDDVKPIDELFQ